MLLPFRSHFVTRDNESCLTQEVATKGKTSVALIAVQMTPINIEMTSITIEMTSINTEMTSILIGVILSLAIMSHVSHRKLQRKGKHQ